MDISRDQINALVAARRIPVVTRKAINFIDLDEVDFIKSGGKYCYVNFVGGKKPPLRLRRTLYVLEAFYSREGLKRIHRGILLNIKQVKEFQGGKDGIVYLYDGRSLYVSRNYITSLRNDLLLK